MGKKIKLKTPIAKTFWQKSKGLIGKKEFLGLLILNCHWIHTFGMRKSIDIIFLNNNFQVISLFTDLKPWRLSPKINKASHILELSGQSIVQYNIKAGDYIKIN